MGERIGGEGLTCWARRGGGRAAHLRPSVFSAVQPARLRDSAMAPASPMELDLRRRKREREEKGKGVK